MLFLIYFVFSKMYWLSLNNLIKCCCRFSYKIKLKFHQSNLVQHLRYNKVIFMISIELLILSAPSCNISTVIENMVTRECTFHKPLFHLECCNTHHSSIYLSSFNGRDSHLHLHKIVMLTSMDFVSGHWQVVWGLLESSRFNLLVLDHGNRLVYTFIGLVTCLQGYS